MTKSGWIILALAIWVGACTTPRRIWYGHSPDRRHVAEVLEKRGVSHIRLDDQHHGRYPGIATESIMFSDDSRYLAFAAETTSGWVVIRESLRQESGPDRETGRPWAGIGDLAIGPNGRLAYAAADSGRWRVVLDGDPGPTYDAVMEGSLTFSPNGRRFGYVVAEDDGYRVVADGEPGPVFEAVGALRFSRDTQRLAYVVRKANEQFLVIEGARYGPYLAIADYTFGPSGRLAMLVRESDGWHAVIDGHKSEAYESISAIVFSARGRYAYAARRGDRWRTVWDGGASRPYDLVEKVTFVGESPAYVIRHENAMQVVAKQVVGAPFAHVGNLVVEDTTLAYLAASDDGSRFVVYNGAVHPLPGAIEGTLVLSVGGRHWACLATVGKDVVMVIDGIHRRPFDVGKLLTQIALGREASGEEHEQMLRRWVQAELEAQLD